MRSTQRISTRSTLFSLGILHNPCGFFARFPSSIPATGFAFAEPLDEFFALCGALLYMGRQARSFST